MQVIQKCAVLKDAQQEGVFPPNMTGFFTWSQQYSVLLLGYETNESPHIRSYCTYFFYNRLCGVPEYY